MLRRPLFVGCVFGEMASGCCDTTPIAPHRPIHCAVLWLPNRPPLLPRCVLMGARVAQGALQKRSCFCLKIC